METKVTVFIALGTNLGDRMANLTHALELLQPQVQVTEQSDVFETIPWGVRDQPLFLNQVIKGTTQLAPEELLDFLKAIETEMGREPSVRYGPRLIDLDILLYGDEQIQTERLQVPHPRMLERVFVMLPLAQLAPDLVIPGTHEPVIEVLDNLDPSGISIYP
ncbi:MAG TPA: 2-amino-4-hydroxy-6-hydroxymethyldihydropteridine diphosphokinase [Anaerolineaceae bacterium]|nr:2-amino-4-hydroxy-6-hydroxymethyldihydropteridine diphosphokinase [Anaerolineaceae bacterium]